MVSQIQAWLAGKKTYIFGLLTALDGIYQYYVQHQSDWRTLVTYLIAGGGLAALRAAISKTK